MLCINRFYKAVLLISLTFFMVFPAVSLDLNSSGSLQYYGDGDLDFEVGTAGDATLPGIADFSSSGITFQKPFSVESSGPFSVGSGIDLTDSTSNTIDSYSTFYLTTSSGTPTDIVLEPTGNVGINGNLNLNSNSLTNFFGSACSSGNVVAHVNDDGTLDCVNAADEVQDTYVNRNGDTMTGQLDMQSNSIVGISNLGGSGIVNSNNIASNAVTPTELNESASYSLGWGNLGISQNDVSVSNLGAADSNLNMNGNSITNFFGSQCSSGNVAVHVNDDGTIDCVDATGEVSGDFVDRSGDTMTGNLDMQDNDINGVDQISIPDNSDSPGKILLSIGDDSYLTDVDSSNTLGIYGQNDDTTATINLGSGGASITGTSGGELDMGGSLTGVGSGNINLGDGSGDINMNGNRIYDSSLGHFQSAGVSDTLSNTQNNLDTLGPNSLYVADDVSVGGDFIGAGGDVAENIETENDREIEPGTVTTISGDIEVKPSSEKRDTAVAGIVSTDPGVKLAKERDGVPLALSGVVPVKTTMENGEIEPGDLLTTSSVKGHAMKCQDSLECHGAIIGKAMGSLSEKGKVQTLVTLG